MASIPIIGLGAISAAGCGIATSCQAVYKGEDCLEPLSVFDSGLKVAPLSGQVIHIPQMYSAPNKTASLALAAASEALLSVKNRQGLSLGFVVATTVAGMTRSELFYKQYKIDKKEVQYASEELAYHEPAALSGFLCKRCDGQGFHSLSTACSTGLHAAGIAKRLVENGTYDLCCAVGSDALSLLTIRGFSSLMLIDPTGCKPFDKRRAGTSLGEGAGAILFASRNAAQKLGVQPLAFMSGWGASADCHHMTAPHPQGRGALDAVRAALNDASLSTSDIDMIATHGTATPDNDVAEINAMKTLFGTVPPFCSMKRTLGHTLAASGILEAVFAISAMLDNSGIATGGFEEIDDAIAAVPTGVSTMPIRHILKNAFGFGGNNASAIFSKQDAQG